MPRPLGSSPRGRLVTVACDIEMTSASSHDSLKDAAAHAFMGPFGDQAVQETVQWVQENSG